MSEQRLADNPKRVQIWQPYETFNSGARQRRRLHAHCRLGRSEPVDPATSPFAAAGKQYVEAYQSPKLRCGFSTWVWVRDGDGWKIKGTSSVNAPPSK